MTNASNTCQHCGEPLTNKRASVTYGAPGSLYTCEVFVADDAVLTPKLARSLAVTACGHSNGVEVRMDGTVYRLTAKSAKKSYE